MASQPIIYKAQNKWQAKLVGTGIGDGSAVIRLSGGYTTIQGFDITGSNANGIILAYAGTNASFNKAIENYVHDLVTPCDSNSGTAIETGGGDNYSGISHNDMIGNLIVNITPYRGCPGGHQASGLYAETPNSVIANNIVINAGYGIQSWHAASNITISGNTLVNNLRSITVGAGDSPGGITNDYSLVEKNIIYNSARTAIAESGKTGSHNKYTDNLVYGGDMSISLKNGLRATGTINADPKFVNNTGAAGGNYELQTNSPARWRRPSLDEEKTAIGAGPVGETTTPLTRTPSGGVVPATGVSASASSIKRGQSSVITWTTKNAVSATLNGEGVPLTGSITVHPTVTTTYKVIAKSATGATDWGSATVSVHP
jgi:parallel beta-helix repeat protein